MQNNQLILASASPRRIDLLAQIGIKPDAVSPADIDETPLKNELPRAMVKRLSLAKCKAVAETGTFTLAADTTVALGRRNFGKPADAADARAILEKLSGRKHQVWGGIAVITPTGKTVTRVIKTDVRFKRLSKDELDAYIASGEWQGKAGAYGIQGLAGAFVTEIHGSYTNIVGLSLYDTMNILNGNGYRITHGHTGT